VGYFSHLPLWDRCKHIRRSEHAPCLEDILSRAKVSVTDEMVDLLRRLLDLNPETRISAKDALDHPWFRCHPLAKDVALMPTFPPSNEVCRSSTRRP
jgi:serine/threonine protein kinase